MKVPDDVQDLGDVADLVEDIEGPVLFPDDNEALRAEKSETDGGE